MWITRTDPSASLIRSVLGRHNILATVVQAIGIEPISPALLLRYEAAGIASLCEASSVDVDVVVLVSRHAARLYRESEFFLPECKHIAIGDATLKALAADGDVASGANSEGLLEHPLLQRGPEQVLVVAGQGGRETLLNALCARKEALFKLELYKRVVQNLARLLTTEGDIIEISSVAALAAVNAHLVATHDKHVYHSVRLVVPSRRLASAARGLGFIDPVIAVSANVADMAEAISRVEMPH